MEELSIPVIPRGPEGANRPTPPFSKVFESNDDGTAVATEGIVEEDVESGGEIVFVAGTDADDGADDDTSEPEDDGRAKEEIL